MKKLFVASALALALTVAGQQRASAWSEFKFSAGVNIGWVGGGNQCLGGLYRSAPYPGGPDIAPRVISYPYDPSLGGYGGYPFIPAAPPYHGGGPEFVPPMPGHAGVAPISPVAPLAPVAPLPPLGGPPHVNAGAQPLSGLGTYYQSPTAWYGR